MSFSGMLVQRVIVMKETACAALALAAFASSALAADLPPKEEPPRPVTQAAPPAWTVEFNGYGWASSVSGQSGFGGLPTLDYHADFPKLLEHLQGALMGDVIVRNDVFIAGLDVVWSRLGGARTLYDPDRRRFGGATDLVLTEGIVTAFGGVRIPVGPPRLALYGTLGARYYNSGTQLTISDLYGIGTTRSINKDWVVPTAGLVGRYRFDDRWFLDGQADVGGWSDSATGQALASVGYQWTANVATTLGYRALYTYEKQDTGFDGQFRDRSFRYQQWLYGPFAGLKVTF